MAIMGLVFGALIMRMNTSQSSTNLNSAGLMVQQAIVDAREKIRSPRYSGNPSDTVSINGYGVYFNSDYDFFVYEDVKESLTPANENRWVSSTNDVVVFSYNFENTGIKKTKVLKIKSDENAWISPVTGSDLFITYSENTTGAMPFFTSPIASVPSPVRELKIIIASEVDNADRIGVYYNGINGLHSAEICRIGNSNCSTWINE